MNHHYQDIISRIAEPPQWWDEHAVPRFDPFRPDDTANIYAREAVLLHIECQGCRAAFKVCMSVSSMQTLLGQKFTLADMIRTGEIHFGDPPNVPCCAGGATMNSIPVRVLEYWHRPEHEWRRDPDLEIAIEPDWIST